MSALWEAKEILSSFCTVWGRLAAILEHMGCLPFGRMNRLGWLHSNGFSKISQPAKGDGTYHLQFDLS